MTASAQIGTAWSRAGFTPVRSFQVFGMRRSGNHAIIDWIMRNAPDAATGGVFFNNCKFGRDPLRAYGSLDIYDADREKQPHVDVGDKARIASAGAAPLVVVSYEDRMPQAAEQRQNASNGFSEADFDVQVIIYRSFLNWSASLLAKLKKNAGFGSTDRMRIMGVAFATYVQGLDRVRQPEGIVTICYDEWMVSETYRARTLEKLGLSERDLSRGKVQKFGGGSSFQDKVKTAADLETTERDTQMATDPEYQMILWTAAHDVNFMSRVMPHFESDVERLATLAETAQLSLTLPPREATA